MKYRKRNRYIERTKDRRRENEKEKERNRQVNPKKNGIKERENKS